MPGASLDTARLALRRPTIADYEDSVSLWSDPLVTRFVGGRPATREEVWRRLLGYAGLWDLLGYGYWTVRETATGRYVGEVGFADYHRDLVPALGSQPEIGWVLASWAHGKGFATEAVRAALAWGDAAWGAAETVCIIAEGHAASFRVAERVGFLRRGTADYRGVAMAVLTRAGAPAGR